jgi:PAB-dependent poly(A)-specific ribonuclease subunit 2
MESTLDFSELPDQLDPSILYQDTSIALFVHFLPRICEFVTSFFRCRDHSLVQHDPLRPDELPTPGTVVAIDAEFVKMQQVCMINAIPRTKMIYASVQEESEFRSDGSTKVIRPARLSLARVSVLRGDGPRKGIPFIDDYIHTSEIIVDYLTEFSGIKRKQ